MSSDFASFPDNLPRMPGWVVGARGQTLEGAAFMSGAALATLHQALADPNVPLPLLRARLGLRAAEACVRIIGRRESQADLRDEVIFLRPGDRPGPAGVIWQDWHHAVTRRISRGHLAELAGEHAPKLADWLAAGDGAPAPVARAAAVFQTVMQDCPREEPLALMLADVVLARSMGWDHVVPLMAAGLAMRDLQKTGEELHLACHQALRKSASVANEMAADLARRAVRLKSVAPRLRAKTSDQAVALFLSRDALSAAMLCPMMSDRAARRLCDRLVDLGAVRELTGRATFRLYGV